MEKCEICGREGGGHWAHCGHALPESAGSVSRRVYSRVSEECGKCKDRSVAKDTLRWVLDVIREEQNRGIGGKHLSTYDQ